MPEPPATLTALLTSLTGHKDDAGSLPLDASTLDGTSAASLLTLFSDALQIDSFRLDGVQLPASVTDSTFQASGSSQDVTLELTFEDVAGEVAI